MPNDRYPYGGYGEPSAPPFMQQAQPGPVTREAVIRMPTASEMGGQGPVPWIRYPYFPTAPFYSTDPNVGYQTRYYSVQVLNQTAATEVITTVQFDIPARLIAINAAAVDTAGAGLPVGMNSLDTFLFRLEYTTGDRLHINARLGSSVCGTAGQPGEIGGAGWTIDQGAAVITGITPLRANLRIEVTLVCLEMRGPRNFSNR